jgi:putative ABC transport system permease protein
MPKKPPRIAASILRWILPPKNRDYLLGDYEESFQKKLEEKSPLSARIWYWGQLIHTAPAYFFESFYWRIVMFRNYFIVTLRNIRKLKGFSFINIAGLAVGMACCMVIFLYVASELTYDRYHDDADRIYRMAMWWKVPSGEFQSAGINAGFAPELSDNFTQVESTARYMPIQDRIVRRGNTHFFEERVGYVDQEIFDIFHIPFVYGKSTSALEKPWTVVITRRIAEKYFGKNDPLGKTIEIKEGASRGVRSMSSPGSVNVDFEITGVVENPPSNTHFKYDILVSAKQLKLDVLRQSWHDRNTYTYIKLAPNTDIDNFEEQISLMAFDHVGKQLKAWDQERRYYLQPLAGIHFQSNLQGEMEPPGNMIYIIIYSLIGLLVLSIGCMNFINLSNVRSVYRAKEVGMRKVIGAGRFQLVRQFLGESLIITTIALGFSFLICKILLSLFNETAGTTLTIAQIFHPYVLFSLAGLIVLVGIAAGGYPAAVLTAYKPVSVLKGPLYAGTKGSSTIKILVIFQFAISIFLIIGTLTVFQQLKFMKGRTLGFDKEQKIVIPFRYNAKFSSNFKTIKNELISHHAIMGATASSSAPGRRPSDGYLSQTNEINKPAKKLNFVAIDYDFISQYKIDMVAGRPLQSDKNDANSAILINEAAVKFLGYSSFEEALGKRWYLGWSDGRKVAREIIGITKDFHYQGMQDIVEPLYMVFAPFDFDTLTLTLESGSLGETLSFIENMWQKLYPTLPYEGYFLDEDFDLQYRAEEQIGKLLGIISGMGLVMSTLGLLGLAAFMTQQRSKEIGIRKVLGASISHIVLLFSKTFLRWVLLANIIAWPLAYYTLNKWLQDFAYRVNISPFLFLLAAGIALVVSFLSISYHVIKTAMANPVDALRYE